MITIMSIARTSMAVKKQQGQGAVPGAQSNSLCHFTIGHPIEDSRLTTLPAYLSA